MDPQDWIDAQLPGDRLIAEARERGDAFQEYSTEAIAIQVVHYVEAHLQSGDLLVDRPGATVTIS